MDEGRKRVLGIIAGILVARHLKTTDDLFDSRPSPRTESMVAAAVQWAERIMREIDGVLRWQMKLKVQPRQAKPTQLFQPAFSRLRSVLRRS